MKKPIEWKKKNGFPTRYGYACGHGKREDNGENWRAIGEDSSHNCIEVKGSINGIGFWEQWFHWDYKDGFKSSSRKAERFYERLKI